MKNGSEERAKHETTLSDTERLEPSADLYTQCEVKIILEKPTSPNGGYTAGFYLGAPAMRVLLAGFSPLRPTNLVLPTDFSGPRDK